MNKYLSLTMISILLATLACNTLMPPRPAVQWDTDPEAIVIEANTGGGMMYEPNEVYEARLWGDGRLVWVEESYPRRRILTAQLTPDEMTTLLQKFVDAGFFGWADHYSPGVVYDAPSTCLRVYLSSDSKGVCETVSGAPANFGSLYTEMVNGAGAIGTDFVPERGYLEVTPYAGIPSTSVPQWPTEAFGFSLAQANGQWVEGAALNDVWQLQNTTQPILLIQEGNTYFQVSVLVPGITVRQPPEP